MISDKKTRSFFVLGLSPSSRHKRPHMKNIIFLRCIYNISNTQPYSRTPKLHSAADLHTQMWSRSSEIHLTFKYRTPAEPTATVTSHICMAIWERCINVGWRGRAMPVCCVRTEEEEVERCIHTVMSWGCKGGCDISTRFLHKHGHAGDECWFHCHLPYFYICDVITQSTTGKCTSAPSH